MQYLPQIKFKFNPHCEKPANNPVKYQINLN